MSKKHVFKLGLLNFSMPLVILLWVSGSSRWCVFVFGNQLMLDVNMVSFNIIVLFNNVEGGKKGYFNCCLCAQTLEKLWFELGTKFSILGAMDGLWLLHKCWGSMQPYICGGPFYFTLKCFPGVKNQCLVQRPSGCCGFLADVAAPALFSSACMAL